MIRPTNPRNTNERDNSKSGQSLLVRSGHLSLGGTRSSLTRAGNSILKVSGAIGIAGATSLGRGALVFALQSFAPSTWPLLKAFSLLWALPWQGQFQTKLPTSAATVCSTVCPPVLLSAIMGPILGRVFPDSARTYRFWRQFLPTYVRYRWTMWRYKVAKGYSWEEVEAKWEKRHEWGGEKVYEMMLDLSGYYVKSAQVLASKGDFMPEAWTRRLTPMFDDMPPRPWSQIEQALAKFLQDAPLVRQQRQAGGPLITLDSVFSTCEHDCLASASIAQVHAASLSQSTLAALGRDWQHGSEVVVKVQHQTMQGLMESDIRNLRRICKVVKDTLPYDPSTMLDEMAATVHKEFDFRREARLMSAIADRLQNDGLRIHIAKPVMALTSAELLVMQRMAGVPFSRILRKGCSQELRERAKAAVAELMEAYGCMMLRDGLFHADPHSGNLLLQDNGDLVLLDFGQCKALPVERHLALARLIVAMDDGDAEGITRAMSGMGMNFLPGVSGAETADPELIRIVAWIAFDVRPLPGTAINPLAENAVIKQIPLQNAPEDLFSIGRCIMLLRGLCYALGVNIQAAKVWRKYAEEALRNPRLVELAQENERLDLGR